MRKGDLAVTTLPKMVTGQQPLKLLKKETRGKRKRRNKIGMTRGRSGDEKEKNPFMYEPELQRETTRC